MYVIRRTSSRITKYFCVVRVRELYMRTRQFTICIRLLLLLFPSLLFVLSNIQMNVRICTMYLQKAHGYGLQWKIENRVHT